MATITGLTLEATQAIIAGTVASAHVDGSGHLILVKHDSSTVDAGSVIGPQGDPGTDGTNGTNGTNGSSLRLDQIASAQPTTSDWSNNSHKITGVTAGAASGEVVTFSQIVPKTGGAFTGAVAEAVATLTFATTILVNAALGNTFRITLTASTGTLDAPSNPVDNQKMIVEVKQDGTGSRTMAYNTAYQFTTALPSPTLSTAANAVDILVFMYNSTSTKWRFMGALPGYT